MKKIIWRYIEDVDTYRLFEVIDQPHGFDMLDLFKTGKRLGNNWKPIKIGLWEDTDEKDKPIADFISIGTAPAVNEKGKSVIFPLVSNTVEFLPLQLKIGTYHVMNVELVDCINIDKSEIKRFTSSNRIMSIEKYSFRWDRLEGINMFRIPELGLSRLFVSDELRKKVEDSKLLGLRFTAVPLVDE